MSTEVATVAWEDPAFRADLQRLLEAARASKGHVSAPSWPFALFTTEAGGAYVLEGEHLSLMRRLERQLAGASRRTHGMSRIEARGLLRNACNRAVTEGTRPALKAFASDVAAPVHDWLVVMPLGGSHLPSRRLRVGACILAPAIPRSLAVKRLQARGENLGMKPPVAYTKVAARGSAAAVALARERLAEAASLLDLIRPPDPVNDQVALLRRGDGPRDLAWARGGWLIDDQWTDERGRLAEPYGRLERALRRDADQRSEWERRVLAACRWFSNGWRSEWTADRLVAFISALECLFVASGDPKGATIARRVTERFRLPEHSFSEQEGWLLQLYRDRSAAVHEGQDYLAEMHVERLAELTRIATQHAARHLLANHELHPKRSCRTFAAATSCGTWGVASW